MQFFLKRIILHQLSFRISHHYCKHYLDFFSFLQIGVLGDVNDVCYICCRLFQENRFCSMFTFCCRCDVFSFGSYCKTIPLFNFLFGDFLSLKRLSISIVSSDLAQKCVNMIFSSIFFCNVHGLYDKFESRPCDFLKLHWDNWWRSWDRTSYFFTVHVLYKQRNLMTFPERRSFEIILSSVRLWMKTEDYSVTVTELVNVFFRVLQSIWFTLHSKINTWILRFVTVITKRHPRSTFILV